MLSGLGTSGGDWEGFGVSSWVLFPLLEFKFFPSSLDAHNLTRESFIFLTLLVGEN